MSVWTSLKGLFKSQSRATQAIDYSGSHYVGPGDDFSAWASSNFAYSKNRILSTNEEIFGIISMLSNMVSSLPIHMYHKYQENDGQLSELLRTEPNPNQSGFELINQTEVSRNTTGNGYIWIERDPMTMNPVNLWPIDPGAVIVKRNIDDNTIWYQVDDNEGHHFLIFNTDMIHVKHITPVSSYVGISPIDVLRRGLQFQKEIEDFSLTEMGKKESYIIKYDRSVSKEGRKAILNDFREMVKHNGGAILVENGYDVDRYESKFKPSDLQTVEGISRNRIANAFNVPLSFLNDNAAKATTNPEHAMTELVEKTLIPIIRQYESEFDRKLLTKNQRARGYYFKINVNGLLRGDTAARTQFYQMLIRNGIASQNDLRKLEDLPPVKQKSADALWISKDLYPAENQLKASSIEATAPSTPTKGGDPDGEESDSDQEPKPGDQDAKVPSTEEGRQHTRRSGNVY